MELNIHVPKRGGKQAGCERGPGTRWFFTPRSGAQSVAEPQLPTPWASQLWGAKACSRDGAGDARTCSLTVSEASWGCTASVSMASRRKWGRAQTFHMLQAGDRGGSVTDPVSGLGVKHWLDPGCRANLVSPTTSVLLSGSTTHLSPLRAGPGCDAEQCRAC